MIDPYDTKYDKAIVVAFRILTPHGSETKELLREAIVAVVDTTLDDAAARIKALSSVGELLGADTIYRSNAVEAVTDA